MLLSNQHYLFVFNLFVGVILGSVFYRSDYCMARMFRDMFLFKDYSLLRSLLLLVVTAMVLFYAARLFGLIPLYPPPTSSYPSIATIIGGLIFGVGMVMAGGCVAGTLYKMGGGNPASAIAFIGIILGSIVYSEMHPFWSGFRADTVILKRKLLSEISPQGEGIIIAITVIASGILLFRWMRQGRLFYRAFAEGYLQPWKTAMIIAVLNTLMYIFSGWPMGITTAYAKLGASMEKLLMPSHAAGLLYFIEDSVIAVVSGVTVSGGAGPRTDIIVMTELPLLIGIIAGSFLTALALREFRICGLPPKRQIASALAGGMLMGLGARIASGCNLKFVLGALPLLSLQGVVFVIAMIAGAYFGTHILKRLVLRPGV